MNTLVFANDIKLGTETLCTLVPGNPFKMFHLS